MHRHPLLVLGGLAALVLGFAAGAVAVEIGIVQGSVDNYIAFEAEHFDSLTRHHTSPDRGFLVVDTSPTFTSTYGSDVLPVDTNASGGMALIDDIRVGNLDHSSTVTYKLQFQTAGTYGLYVRDSAFEDNSTVGDYGNEDSFFRPTTFGGAATTVQHGYSGKTEGTYGWRDLNVTYTVNAADVGTWLTFNIDDRESGFSLDRLAFSLNTDLSSTALDALENSALTPTYFDNNDGAGDSNWATDANWTPDGTTRGAQPVAIQPALVGDGRTAVVDQGGALAGDLTIGHTEAVDPGDGTVDVQSLGDLSLGGDLVLGQTGSTGTL